MNYRVTFFQTDEGWAVSCPDLPGFHSQGAVREEALVNIKNANPALVGSGSRGDRPEAF